MADGVVMSCASSHILPEICGNINEYTCNKCSAYEDQLKEALAELGSAQMIIDILQEELLSSVSITNTHDNNIASMEGFVNFNPRRKKRKSPTSENVNLLIPQPFKPRNKVQLVEALCCKPQGCGFNSQLCNWNFSFI